MTELLPGLDYQTNDQFHMRHAEFRGANHIYHGMITATDDRPLLPVDDQAQAALDAAWRYVLPRSTTNDLGTPDDPLYSDHEAYRKTQPGILKELAAIGLYAALTQHDVDITPSEQILVTPQTTEILVEEALATLARSDQPGPGVVLAAPGYGPALPRQAAKAGLHVVSSESTQPHTLKLNSTQLARDIAVYRRSGQLRGLVIKHPHTDPYTDAELADIANLITQNDLRVICDMSDDKYAEQYTPLAALSAVNMRGDLAPLSDHVLSIASSSKGFHAPAPAALGAGHTSNTQWYAAIRQRLTISFQRETTHAARSILEHTAESYFKHNRALLATGYEAVQNHVAGINRRLGRRAIHAIADSGPMTTLFFDGEPLERAGISSSMALEYLIYASAGISSLALGRGGSAALGVQLNAFSPYKYNAPAISRDNVRHELFDRLEHLLGTVADVR